MMKKLDFGGGKKRTPVNYAAKNGLLDFDMDHSLLPQPIFPDNFPTSQPTPVSSLTEKFRNCTLLLEDISCELEKEAASPHTNGSVSPPTISPTQKQASPTMEEIQGDLKFKDALTKVQQLLAVRAAQREKERQESGVPFACGCSTGGGWSSEDEPDEDETISMPQDGEKERCVRCGGIKTLKRKPKIQTKKRSHKKKSQRKTPLAEGKEMKKNFTQMNFEDDDFQPSALPLPDFSNHNSSRNNNDNPLLPVFSDLLPDFSNHDKLEPKKTENKVEAPKPSLLDQKPFDVIFRRTNLSFDPSQEEHKEKNSRYQPGIHLGYPEEGLAVLEGVDDIVIPTCAVSVCYQFPLSGPFWFKYNKIIKKGWTRRELIGVMSESYHSMYEEEEQTTAIPVGAGEGGMARSQTNGTYGIWGHNVSDLILFKMHVTIQPDATYGERAFVDIVVDASS